MSKSTFCLSASFKIIQTVFSTGRKVLISVFAFVSAVLQPSGIASAEFYSMLAPTDYTPSTYIQPQYDAFDHDYYRPPVFEEDEPDTPPVADFSMSTDSQALQSQARGTTTTRFIFDASLSEDNETDTSRLEARWDFENDGKLDSYFSRTKTIRHTFEKAGVYDVKLEILDKAGNISSTVRKVTIVNNTAPSGYFIVSPSTTGTEKTIFNFTTDRSKDDQYLSYYLQYRFDWNGDGKWDTKYNEKTSWNHRFDVPGNYTVIMEVKDPGGSTARVSQQVFVFANTPPIANFSVKSVPNSNGAGYEFNASSSSDKETKNLNLLYRGDFNYNGTDDIIYDTDWSGSPMYSGYYSVPGTKNIKLEVKDEDGLISRSYAQIYVSWTEAMAKKFMTGLR
jgi:plastocyanin